MGRIGSLPWNVSEAHAFYLDMVCWYLDAAGEAALIRHYTGVCSTKLRKMKIANGAHNWSLFVTQLGRLHQSRRSIDNQPAVGRHMEDHLAVIHVLVSVAGQTQSPPERCIRTHGPRHPFSSCMQGTRFPYSIRIPHGLGCDYFQLVLLTTVTAANSTPIARPAGLHTAAALFVPVAHA